MEIFKKKPNLCQICQCKECDQNCNENLEDVSELEILAQNIIYEQFGCPYGVKKRKKEKLS